MWFCSIISHVNLLSLDFLDLFNSLVPLTILLSSYCLKYITYTYNIHKVRSFTNLVSLFEFHFEISIQSNLWNFHTYLLCGVGDSSYIFAVPLHLFSCHMCFITLPSLSHTKKWKQKPKKEPPLLVMESYRISWLLPKFTLATHISKGKGQHVVFVFWSLYYLIS